MGQKSNPIGLRLGIIRSWDANWYNEKNFAAKLTEDLIVRNYLRNRLRRSGVSRIVIERTAKQVRLTIHTSRPGVIIGRSGKEIAQLEEELRHVVNQDQAVPNQDVKILINEVKRPELDAYLVAENIAQQLEGRVSFRRAMKQAIASAMRMGAEGIRIMCAGRLGGAEMSRTEQYKEGRIPLHTLRADIDYAQVTSLTKQGAIGVKVWICKGEVLGQQQQQGQSY